MKKRNIMIMLTVLIICLPIILSNNVANAYVISDWKKQSRPKGLLYNIHSSVSDAGFSSYASNGAKAWNASSKIEFVGTSSQPGLSDVYFTFSNVTTDDYATAYGSKSSSQVRITFWKDFKGLSATRKTETAVHEVGHALGLDHTQKANNSISVMRKTGFNDKKTPLSDDWAGINKIY
ncbi:matrixin family metalloprotease [Heyndrickxia sporothermodurans]|nr:matrixin family metalloprotease [Heyndrickxia sporothermodurans]MED3655155.1 matrixin family metalloprotease [Heyndrickxia sporothermodurans]